MPSLKTPLVEPSEHAAAVLTGWSVAWGMQQVGIPSGACIMAGFVIWAFIFGGYRGRWLEAMRNPGPDTDA